MDDSATPILNIDTWKSRLASGDLRVVVIGLGYVGAPLAACLRTAGVNVMGYDLSQSAVDRAVSCSIPATTSEAEAFNGRVGAVIVCVPTPVTWDNSPDLSPLRAACNTIMDRMAQDEEDVPLLVSVESTVYPGVTEKVFGDLVVDGAKWGARRQVCLGYAPERINPGDTYHSIFNTARVISGDSATAADMMKVLYSRLKVDLHVAPSIKVAEAAKLMENVQRDVNIALVNEAAFMFKRLGINPEDVWDAASTKWNWYNARPGLPGGHCIGVDPYYYLDLAKQLSCDSTVAGGARSTNVVAVGKVAHGFARIAHDVGVEKVVVWGLTYKANVPDFRNSQAAEVLDAIQRVHGSDFQVLAYDPFEAAAASEFQLPVGVTLVKDPFKIEGRYAILVLNSSLIGESALIQAASRAVCSRYFGCSSKGLPKEVKYLLT